MKNIIIGLSTILALYGAHVDVESVPEKHTKANTKLSLRNKHTGQNLEMTRGKFIERFHRNPDEFDGEANWDDNEIPGVVKNGGEKLPKERVFSRQISRNAFPENDEESTPSENSVMVEIPYIEDNTKFEQQSAPKKTKNDNKKCCVVL